ncbi:MAG: hypothetical protein HDR81_01715 [Bacteroides sp.]|nr:hypothetical protein [Bacteroides sp.]
MKLIPKAKPVRFRITSGNVEHNSLDSLQENFVWQDIVPLFDGRLVKWLRHLNETEVADRIASIQDPEKEKLQVCQILFKIDEPITIEGLIEDNGVSKKALSLINILIDALPLDKLLLFVNKYSTKTSVFINELARRVEDSLQGDISKEDLYSIGMSLYANESYKKMGISCIQLAAEKGYKSAKEFAQHNIDKDINELLKSKAVIININNSWKIKKPIGKIGKTSNEQAIYDFSDSCLKLHDRREVTYASDLDPLVKKEFLSAAPEDPFYCEKIFVAAIVQNTQEKTIKYLNKIKEAYSLAERFDRENRVTIGAGTIRKSWWFNNCGFLGEYVSNLGKFRTNGESGK